MARNSAAAGPMTVRAAALPSRVPREPARAVTYHSAKTLASIRRGDAKARVFDRFGTTFTKEHGKLVKVEGMRLRASRMSDRKTRIEVAEVSLMESDGRKTAYWFLFENSRLIEFGRPEQWKATAAQYRVDLDDRHGFLLSAGETKAGLRSGR